MPMLRLRVTGAAGGRYVAPSLSITKRFRFRICTAPSLSTRRQAGSQGASHTRPQMELKALVEVIASKAPS